MSSPVLPPAGPSPAAGPAAEKEAKSADLCLIYSGPLLTGVEVTKAVWGDAPLKPCPLPAVETPTLQTHQAPSLSASVLSSCPVRRGGRAEGTRGGSCSPSRGLRNQSNKSQGEHLHGQPLMSTAPRTSAHLSRLDAEHQRTPSSPCHSCTDTQTHTHAQTLLPPWLHSTGTRDAPAVPLGNRSSSQLTLLSTYQVGPGFLHCHTCASAVPSAWSTLSSSCT